MCGIVGYVGKKDCTKVLLDSLSKLEYRGYDSAGIAVFENDAIKTKKTKGRLADLEEKLKTSRTFGGELYLCNDRRSCCVFLCNCFCICLRFKDISLFQQKILDSSVVFNDTVMNDRNIRISVRV